LPELPEVETVVRSIAPHLVGQTIREAQVFSRRVTRGDFALTTSKLTGALIDTVRRRGKQIFIELDRGVLYIHLGMTGKLLWVPHGFPHEREPKPNTGKYTRAILYFDTATLLYDDVRQFGRFEFYEEPPEILTRVGPDALTISFDDFFKRLKRHHGHIKPLLLNQTFIGGVGNIYADESLFAAQIHPRTPADRLSKVRAEKLFTNLIEILNLAIRHRGSSISDYVDAAGARGDFQQHHSVYGRDGQPCSRCGSPIRRIVLGQRGTHYCPRCQRV
jgi:formamidopyrimidine-DNA glycosylase